MGVPIAQLTPRAPVDTHTRVIVCAAVRWVSKEDKEVAVTISSPRHWDITTLNTFKLLSKSIKEYIATHCEEEQGFLDQWGNYITREEGIVLAKATGQYKRYRDDGHTYTKLFSEELY